MRKIETKICKKCGRPYSWTSGGIVMTPGDYADRGRCPKCRHTTPGKREKIRISYIDTSIFN